MHGEQKENPGAGGPARTDRDIHFTIKVAA
jgi:hypothetical protein